MNGLVRTGALGMAAIASLSACATSPRKIEAAHISLVKYQNLNCDQIGLERSAVEYRANILYHDLKKRAGADAAKMGVGVALFLPTLFFLKGDGVKAAEFAQMKGDYQALRIASEDKGCDIHFTDLEKSFQAKVASADLVTETIQ